MHSNWENIGNNLPPGFNDMGDPYGSFGHNGRYNQRIRRWEEENKEELEELKNMVLKELRSFDIELDEDFQDRLEELKKKFPKQYDYFRKKY
jgi:hypothetical protein